MNMVQAAAKLYEARDAMVSLYGDRFSEKVAEFRPFIEAAMKKHQVDVLQAAIKLCKDLEGAGLDSRGNTKILIMATAVEMIEPLSRKAV